MSAPTATKRAPHTRTRFVANLPGRGAGRRGGRVQEPFLSRRKAARELGLVNRTRHGGTTERQQPAGVEAARAGP